MSLTLSQRPRVLAPEILDDLPAQHPDARKSRDDLRRFNAAMGNWRWFEKRMPALVGPGEPVLELGAGTGELAELMRRRGLTWDGVDRAPRPESWPASARWHKQDIFDFDAWAQYPVVAGNLIFHHFDAEQLARLGRHLDAHARLLVVGDLARGRLQQCLFYGLALSLRAHPVSRHDGWVSIAAGFRGNELPDMLGLSPKRWTWQLERFQQICAYRLIATRRP